MNNVVTVTLEICMPITLTVSSAQATACRRTALVGMQIMGDFLDKMMSVVCNPGAGIAGGRVSHCFEVVLDAKHQQQVREQKTSGL